MNVPQSQPSACDRPLVKLGSSCAKGISSNQDSGLAMLVCQYKESESYQWQEHDLYKWYGDKALTLEAAVDRAFKSEQPNGKLHGHQYLVGRERLARLATIAKDYIERFKDARDWNEIYTIVGDTIVQVPGAGILAHYDITNRIGSYLRYDQTVVRVHAGAWAGAAVLGLKIQNGQVNLEDLPPELRSLGAMHIENFLCIYKDELKQLNRLKMNHVNEGAS